MYIFFSVCSDAAGKLTIHKNGKGVNRMWVGIDHRAEKGKGVIHCVGIGKPIAQIGLYIAVVKAGASSMRQGRMETDKIINSSACS